MRFYLHKIEDVYYYRQAIPKDLRTLFGRNELKKSLKTREYRAARVQVKALVFRTEKLFTQLRSGMLTDKQIERMVKEYLDTFLEVSEQERSGEVTFNNPVLLSHFQKLQERSEAFYTSLHIPEVDETIVDTKARIYEYKAGSLQRKLATNDFTGIEEIVSLMLAINGYADIPKGSPDFQKICREFLKKEINAYRIEAERTLGEYHGEFGKLYPGKSTAPQSVNLKELIDLYKKEVSLKDAWRESTRVKNEGVFNIILELLGNIDIAEIDAKRMLQFFEDMKSYPSNRNKGRYAGKSLAQIRQMKDVKPLAPSSVNYNMTLMSSILIFAQKKNLGVTQNFAEGLQVKIEVKDSEQQAEYSKADIESMFRELAKIRKLVQPERFWIPFLALYSGARLNELCQLYVEDIIEKDGIPCIAITAATDDKATKNRQSERTVPIHPVIIKLGFMKYVESMQGRHERLWPNLKFKRGNYKEDFGKWFNRTLQNKYIAEGERKSFHSLRHSFINFFVQRIDKVPLHILKSMVGHLDDGKGKDITLQRYGKELEPRVLLKTLKMLDYGVDFGLLERSGQ